MKLIVFTDSHLDSISYRKIKEKALKNKPDLMVCCGDISIFGSGLDQVAKFLNSLNIPTLVIPGNHESPEEIKKISSKYKNLINLHNGTYEFQEFLFFGWGTGGFSLVEPEFEKLSKQFKKTYDRKKKLIFVTHAPIYGTKLDYIYEAHRGCKSTRKFVEEAKPILTLCGHFHETFGKKDKINKTLIINPGSEGMLIELKRK